MELWSLLLALLQKPDELTPLQLLHLRLQNSLFQILLQKITVFGQNSRILRLPCIAPFDLLQTVIVVLREASTIAADLA